MAVEMLADSAERERDAEHRGWRDGFDLGYRMGLDAGRQAAEKAEERRWSGYAPTIKAVASQPAFAEMQRRRRTPHGSAYFGAVIRHNGTEYGGLGRPRVPAPAAAVEAAVTWAQQKLANAGQGVT